MRKKERNAAHLIFLILITAFVLGFADLVVFAGLFSKWKEDIPFGSQTIMENLKYKDGDYSLSEDVKGLLEKDDLFTFIISESGSILWEERLPKELEKEYTVKDVALFTRYYLDDYPVHTYVIPDGLLIIGSGKNTTWKYTLEYNEGMIRQFIRQMPVLVIFNLVLLIAVPLFVQRKWVKKSEEERTEWIAGVSHDIRTPLTLILGNADYISKNAADEAVKERADQTIRQGVKIRTLVANLNAFSKLEYGMDSFSRAPEKICSLLRRIVADYVDADYGENYQFALNIEESLNDLAVRLNEGLFRRMMENLINNAIHHNPDGCNIVVSLAEISSGKNRFALTVSDDGAGTSDEIIKELNHKGELTTGKLGDHGLGLRLVKQIAAFHHWKVSFRRNEPRGFVSEISIR